MLFRNERWVATLAEALTRFGRGEIAESLVGAATRPCCRPCKRWSSSAKARRGSCKRRHKSCSC
jgi:hypothetical protein